MASESGSRQAQKRWELENDVTMEDEDLTARLSKQDRKLGAEAVGGSSSRGGAGGSKQMASAAGRDDFWKYDKEAQRGLAEQAPWAKDPHYFKTAYVSALALLKMTIHTKQGGNIEVMGMLQGKPVGDAIVVLDAFVLPVEGTETRVNAQAEAYEYMVEYNQRSKESGREENVVGWYHSHPGYGCWLSGIDVNTQMLNQEYTEPFLAIVIDPIRTQAAGKVEIGAFRTYPKDYKAAEGASSEGSYQTIPLAKVEDWGVHASKYYSLEVQYFKSGLDANLFELLWNKYWVSTLSSSKGGDSGGDYLTTQMKDLVERLEIEEGRVHAGRLGGWQLSKDGRKKGQLSKIAQDGCKVATEQLHSMLSQMVKDRLFNKGGVQ